MHIVDTFSYSEPYEADVLLVKLHVESEGITEWLIVDNKYTLRGELKGYSLKNLLDTDTRFTPFLDRIKVMETDFTYNIPEGQDHYAIMMHQRSVSVPYILDTYKEGDWVIVSDIDEIYDFSNEYKHKRMKDILSGLNQPVIFPILRYWYDYDNIAYYRYAQRFMPFKEVRKANALGKPTPNTIEKPGFDDSLGFEYTFCFDKEHIFRKLTTYAHTNFDMAGVERALQCNHWVQKKSCNVGTPIPSTEYPGENNQWFEKVELNSQIAPTYVLEHIEELQTNSVDPNYKENRKSIYPQFFGEA